MRGLGESKLRDGFLTIEMIVSLGLAAAAFASFLAFYDTVRQQNLQLKHFVNATLVLQSKLEEIRLGQYGPALEELRWSQVDDRSAAPWETMPLPAGGVFTWRLTAERKPAAGQLFAFKAVLTWTERGKTERVSAATQLVLQ